MIIMVGQKPTMLSSDAVQLHEHILHYAMLAFMPPVWALGMSTCFYLHADNDRFPDI